MTDRGDPPSATRRRDRPPAVVDRPLAERNLFANEPPRPLPPIRTPAATTSSAAVAAEKVSHTDSHASTDATKTQRGKTPVPTCRILRGPTYDYTRAEEPKPARPPKTTRPHTSPCGLITSPTDKRPRVGSDVTSPEQRLLDAGARAYSQPPRSPSSSSTSVDSTPRSTPSVSPDRRSDVFIRHFEMEELGGESAWTDATSYATFAKESAGKGASPLSPRVRSPQPSTSYAATAAAPATATPRRKTPTPPPSIAAAAPNAAAATTAATVNSEQSTAQRKGYPPISRTTRIDAGTQRVITERRAPSTDRARGSEARHTAPAPPPPPPPRNLPQTRREPHAHVALWLSRHQKRATPPTRRHSETPVRRRRPCRAVNRQLRSSRRPMTHARAESTEYVKNNNVDAVNAANAKKPPKLLPNQKRIGTRAE
ncbi:unnamed protein product, partial [Iphiclides podalirius]